MWGPTDTEKGRHGQEWGGQLSQNQMTVPILGVLSAKEEVGLPDPFRRPDSLPWYLNSWSVPAIFRNALMRHKHRRETNEPLCISCRVWHRWDGTSQSLAQMGHDKPTRRHQRPRPERAGHETVWFCRGRPLGTTVNCQGFTPSSA